MFNKLKQFKDLRSQAKTLQNLMAQEVIELERNGVKIQINGNFEITSLLINDDLDKTKLELTIKELINDALKKVQRRVAEKMQGMGGFSGL